MKLQLVILSMTSNRCKTREPCTENIYNKPPSGEHWTPTRSTHELMPSIATSVTQVITVFDKRDDVSNEYDEILLPVFKLNTSRWAPQAIQANFPFHRTPPMNSSEISSPIDSQMSKMMKY